MSTLRNFRTKYGPWALVTGAARGLGAEFSRQIAALGIDLVLVDQLEDELAQVAAEIQNGGRQVRAVVADLADGGSVDAVCQQTEGLEIGLLVSNAAHMPVRLFLEASLEDKLRTVAVNVRAPLILAHELGPRMADRGRGGIIFLASAAALQGVAYVADYAASKAFNLILAEGLWDELGQHGVDVLGFMPGATRTPGLMNSRPRLERSRLATLMEPEPTVSEALRALGRRPNQIAGRRNRWSALLMRMMPRKMAITLVGNTMRAWYGNEQ